MSSFLLIMRIVIICMIVSLMIYRNEGFMNRYHVKIRRYLLANANDMNWDPKAGPKLDFNEDYYSVLEVASDIDFKELKKAYYKIVFEYHPDRKHTDEEKDLCNKQMMVINNAYKILKDEKSRKDYDLKRRSKFNRSSPFSSSSDAYSDMLRKKQQDEATKQRKKDVTNFDRNAFFQELFEDSYNDDMGEDLYDEAYSYFNQESDEDIFQRKYGRYTATTGSSGYGNKSKDIYTRISEVVKARDKLEKSLMDDPRDWGEVTDRREIQQRLRDINEVKRLEELIIELRGELDYQEWVEQQNQPKTRSTVTGGSGASSSSSSSSSSSASTRSRTNNLWEELIGVISDEDGGGDDIFRETFRDGKSNGSSEYDDDGVPLWRKAQAEQRRQNRNKSASSTSSSRGSGGEEVEGGERSGDDYVREELERLLGIQKKKKDN